MEPPVPEAKGIILGVPHTSSWDFIISFLYYHSVGGKAYVMVKKEFFWGPLAPIMRAMGAIPVDRKKGATLTRQIIEEFKTRDHLHMAIILSTRIHHYFIGRLASSNSYTRMEAAVYLGYFDWKTKTVGRGEKIELTDDVQADMKRIRKHYKEKGIQGKHPELFTTGSDIE